MNELQERFFQYLAKIQESCVEVCMSEHHTQDEKIKSMLYDVTYEMTVELMELIDGYSGYSREKHDIVNTVTGKRLKENPFIELHDVVEKYLKYE